MNQNFSWGDSKTQRQIFFAGTLYFILTTIYSLFYYEEKFLLDGCSIVFYIVNNEWFAPAQQREVMWLGQIIPVTFSIAGLELKWVMIGYIINVYLIYFVLFLITIRIFQDPLSAILLVLVHFKGDPHNYFFMVEELLPGVCLLIVLVSLLRNFDKLKSPGWGYASIIFLMLFIVRSHPLAMVCLGCAAVILMLSNPESIRRNRKIAYVSGVAFVIFAGFKLLNMGSYDMTMMSNRKSIFQSVYQLLNPVYLSDMALYLFHMRKIFTLIFSVTVLYFIVQKKYGTLTVFLGVTFFLVALFNTQIDQYRFSEFELSHTSYDRWSLPIRFLVFSAFSLLVLRDINTMRLYKAAGFLAIFYFTLGGIGILEEQRKSSAYIDQANMIIQKCREEGVSKAMIRLDQLDRSVMLHDNSFMDIMVLSSQNSSESTIQVVYVSPEEMLVIEQMDEDLVLLNKNEDPFDEDFLNEQYFNLAIEQYELVNLEE